MTAPWRPLFGRGGTLPARALRWLARRRRFRAAAAALVGRRAVGGPLRLPAPARQPGPAAHPDRATPSVSRRATLLTARVSPDGRDAVPAPARMGMAVVALPCLHHLYDTCPPLVPCMVVLVPALYWLLGPRGPAGPRGQPTVLVGLIVGRRPAAEDRRGRLAALRPRHLARP